MNCSLFSLFEPGEFTGIGPVSPTGTCVKIEIRLPATTVREDLEIEAGIRYHMMAVVRVLAMKVSQKLNLEA
jgi:hypothetical protein